METDLDRRIRDLVGRAVADAPPAPELPTYLAAGASPRASRDGQRARWWAGGAALAAAATIVAVVVTGGDGTRRITPHTDPTATAAPTPQTSAPSTPSTDPPAAVVWPAGIVVIVASERGVERVSAEDGTPVVRQVGEPGPVGLAFETATGLVTDVAYRAAAGTVLQDVSRDGKVMAMSADVATSNCSTSGTINICQNAGRWDYQGDVDAIFGSAARPVDAQLVAVSPTGDTIAWVSPGELVVRRRDHVSTERVALAGGTTWSSLDLTDDAAVVSRDGGAPALVDIRPSSVGEVIPVPVATGRATISLLGTSAAPAEPSTSPSPSSAEPPATTAHVVTASFDGVWVNGQQWSSTGKVMALRRADGSLVAQGSAGYADVFAQTTWPVAISGPDAAPRVMDEFDLPEDRWLRIHDIAVIGGREAMLVELQPMPNPQGADAGTLELWFFDTAERRQIAADVGGWERGVSRLSMSNTGLVVGEAYDGVTGRLFAIGGLFGSDPTGLDPTTLGLDDSYSDCNDCPRLYTIDQSGGTVAWLAGTVLVRWSIESAAVIDRTDLGSSEQLGHIDGIDISGDVVVLDRWSPWADASMRQAPLLINLATNERATLPGGAVALADTP